MLGVLCFLCLPLARADEVKGGYNQTLLEYQQKYLVPAAVADTLWRYLRQAYQTGELQKTYPAFTAEATREIYLDEYYDDGRHTLLRGRHSLRLRRVFAGKLVDRQFIQVKISTPAVDPVRQEIKFNLNDRPDKKGGDPGHPFLRLIRSADRLLLDSVLAGLQVPGRDLRPVLSCYQHRRRLYLRERGNELAYISLDAVSTEDGQVRFYELELALDEPAYTRAKARQRQRSIQVLLGLERDLTRRFPALRPDQTPKYNKLYTLQQQLRPRPGYYDLAWLGVGLVLGGLGLYLFLTRHRPAPQPRELL